MTAYEGGGTVFNRGANGSAWLRQWGVESVGLAAEFSDFALPSNLTTEAGLRRWLSTEGGGWQAFKHHPGDPDPGHLVAGWLPSIAGGGAAPSLYLYSGLPGSADPGDPSGAHGLPPPANGTRWGVAAAGVVRLVRQAAAGTGTPVDVVHIGNEANNFMWKYNNCSSSDASCAPWEDFFSAAATTLKKEVPGVRIGGPVLCWGPSGYNQPHEPDWYTWHLWSKPTIERGLREGTLDFFDFHAYSSDSLANRLLADVHTVAAMGRASPGGVLLPSAITETSFALPPTNSGVAAAAAAAVDRAVHFNQRTLPVARDILSLCAHPDKVILRQQHDLGFAPFRFNSDDDAHPTPDQQLYKLLAPLRGLRVEHELNASGADLLLEVAHNRKQGLLVLAAANFEPETLQLQLQLDHPFSALAHRPPAGQWGVGVLDAVSLRAGPPVAFTPAGNGSAIASVQIPPRSILVVRIPLQQAGATPIALSDRREYFSRDVMAKASCDPLRCADPDACLRCGNETSTGGRIRIDTSIALPVGGVPSGSRRTWLRLGLHGDGVRCPAWTITLSIAANIDGSGASSSTKVVFEPTAEFRAGGCAARTQNCSGVGSRTPDDGYQNSFAELLVPAGWAAPRGDAATAVRVEMEGCVMASVRRTRTPATYLSFVSLVVEVKGSGS